METIKLPLLSILVEELSLVGGEEMADSVPNSHNQVLTFQHSSYHASRRTINGANKVNTTSNGPSIQRGNRGRPEDEMLMEHKRGIFVLARNREPI